jgi:hypothetical protein
MSGGEHEECSNKRGESFFHTFESDAAELGRDFQEAL